MKKTLLFLGLASVMSVFTGCTKDELTGSGSGSDNSPKAPQTLIAQVGEGATRTAISPDGKSVVWSAKDAIAVYSSSNAGKYVKYTLSSGANSSVGTFTTTNTTDEITGLPYGFYDEGSGDPYLAYVAVYPADNFWIDPANPELWKPNNDIGATIPEFQEATAGSYDKAAFPMVAVLPKDPSPSIDPLSLHFRYIASLIRMPLKGAVTLSQIEIAEMDEYAPVTGPISYQYQPEPWYFSTIADRDAFFFDYSTPLNYDYYNGTYVGQRSVKLIGDIALSSTATDYYAVVFAKSYTGFHVYFTLEDGSKIEKQIVPKGNNVVKMGDVMALPEMEVAASFFSTVTLNGETITWTTDAAATSYSLVVGVGEATLFTIDNISTSVDFTTDIVSRLKPFIGGAIPVGEEVPISLSVKAVYANKAVAEATYSVPVEKMFEAPVPEIIGRIFESTVGNGYFLIIDNMAVYERFEYAVIPGKTSDPEAFKDVQFIVADPEVTEILVGGPYDTGEYSVMAKATAAGEVKTIILSWKCKNVLPSSAFSLTVAAGEFSELPFMDVTFKSTAQVSDYQSVFGASSTGQLYVKKNSSDTDDWTGVVPVTLTMDYSFAMPLADIVAGLDITVPYAFRLEITGTNLGEGITKQAGVGTYTPVPPAR